MFNNYDFDEKTKNKLDEERKRFDYRRKIINQTNIRIAINMLGKESFVDILEHINDNNGEIFDFDGGCEIISCRFCGACGSNDYNLQFKAIIVNEKQLVEYEDEGTEDEVKKLYWLIDCRICGESWSEYLKEVNI